MPDRFVKPPLKTLSDPRRVEAAGGLPPWIHIYGYTRERDRTLRVLRIGRGTEAFAEFFRQWERQTTWENVRPGRGPEGAPMTRTVPPDYAAAWEACLHERETGRLDATADRGYWEHYAPHEDPRTPGRGACAQTLAVISSLVRIGDSLLDVGAGTGRLALPLSRCVGHVTALDQAPATLEILRRRARVYGIENLTALEVDWGLQTVQQPEELADALLGLAVHYEAVT
jgi:hypothetical protein